jgi:hypothetical protein
LFGIGNESDTLVDILSLLVTTRHRHDLTSPVWKKSKTTNRREKNKIQDHAFDPLHFLISTGIINKMICKTNRHNSYLLVVVVSILCGISCHIYEISGFCYTRRRSGFSPDILRRQKSIVGRRTKSTQTRRRRRRRSAATIAGVDDTTLFFSDEISSDKAKTRQQSILHIIIEKRKKILLIPPALVVVVLFLPRLLKRQLLPFKGALNYHHISKKLRWNNIARYFFVVLFVSSIFSTINTRRRQSIDPTSEWSRYARRPGARGRAILSLFVKQAFMILTARIVDSIGIDKVAARLRQNAGKTFSNGILKLGPLYIKVRISLYI